MPAWNEEEGVVETIRSVPLQKLKNAGYDVEILVVDGGSTDNTVILAKKAGARVISSDRGYGKQYKVGLQMGNGDIIVTGDSDGTYPFEHIMTYVRYLEKNSVDFITINRMDQMDSGAMPFSNKIGNVVLTFFTNLLFGLRLKDSQSGMWILRRTVLEKLNLKAHGFPFCQEFKIEAFRKVRSIELSGSYKKRLGKSKLRKSRDGIGNLCALCKKRLEMTIMGE